MSKILVIVAHPDDEVLGAGATLSRLAQEGHDIHVCILCESSSPRYENNMVDILKENAYHAGKVLGIKGFDFYDLANVKTNSISMKTFLRCIRETLEKVKPKIIFTHHRGDVHVDHRMVFKAVMCAARSYGHGLVKEILCCEVASSTEWAPPHPSDAFMPNVFYGVDGYIGLKAQAMSIYKSELKEYPHPRSLKALYKYARRWGVVAGVGGYVEPFELIRQVR